MIKTLLHIAILLLISIPAKAFNGNGTLDAPYTINNAKELRQLSDSVKNGESFYNKHFKITSDINLSDVNNGDWQPIGWFKKTTLNTPFEGIVNGGGHTISNYHVKADKHMFIGLFGYTRNATISNLKIENYIVEGIDYVGGLVGVASDNTTLKNIEANNGQVTGCRFVGGIAGYISEASYIEESKNTSTIKGNKAVGGIAGWLDTKSVLQNTSNTGTIIGKSYNIGGITGSATKNSRIDQCANSGSINSTSMMTGGICGYIDNSMISSSTNTGHIIATNDYVGGISGYMRRAKISSTTNAGFVEHKDTNNTPDIYACVGGISGYAAYNSVISQSLNLNDIKSSDIIGGIVGYARKVTIENSYYDRQMCIAAQPCGNKNETRLDSLKKYTCQLTGNNLKNTFGDTYTYKNGLYPRINGETNKNFSYAAALPIILEDTTQTIYSINSNFTMTPVSGYTWITANKYLHTYGSKKEKGTAFDIGTDTMYLKDCKGNFIRKFPASSVKKTEIKKFIVEDNFTSSIFVDSVLHANEMLPKGVWSVSDTSTAEIDPDSGRLTTKRKGEIKVFYTLPNGKSDWITVNTTKGYEPERIENRNDPEYKPDDNFGDVHIRFAFNNTNHGNIPKSERVKLDKLAAIAKQDPTLKIKVTGHTCDIGSEAVNYRVGLKRANYVTRMLIKMGVIKDNIKTESMGETKPIVRNTSKHNREINRRVVIEIMK